MDVPRCLCAYLHCTSDDKNINPKCPLHGTPGKDPVIAWKLGPEDQRILRAMRIKAE